MWNADSIIECLAEPNAFWKKFLTSKGQADPASGSTKMTFRLVSEKERKAVVAFLVKNARSK